MHAKRAKLRNDDLIKDQLEEMSNLEGIIIIWFDATLNVSKREKLRITKHHIRSISNTVEFHKDEEQCINRIKSITDERILLVISGSAAQNLLSLESGLIHKSVQAIFIFCYEKKNYEFLRAHYPKIIDIFDNPEALKTAIKTEVDSIQTHLETFNFYNKIEQNSMRNLSKQAVSFLWLQVIKASLVWTPKDQNAKNEMIKICKNYYHGNRGEMRLIEEFDRSYRPEEATRWYTRNSFIYKLVNRALRIEDIEQLYIFRFYIRDLCEEISKIYKTNTYQQSLIYYRGVRLPMEDVIKWKESEGQLISTNGFLSTSRSKEVAMQYALCRTETDKEESVLIEIECNQSSAPFAILEKFSAFSHEREVLFDLGATFEVLTVTCLVDEERKINFWTIKLRTTLEGTELAQEYIERSKKSMEPEEIREIDVWFILLYNMGEYSKAFKFLAKKYPAESSTELSVLSMRAILSNVCRHEDYDEALKYFEYKQENCRGKGILEPLLYFLKARLYAQQCKYDKALLELTNWIEPNPKLFIENDALDTGIYRLIGEIYYYKGQYELSIYYFDKSNEIGKKCISNQEIYSSGYLSGLGAICRQKGEMLRAKDYYLQAVEKEKKHYPIPPSSNFYQIGCVFESLGNYEKSLKYYREAAELAEKRGKNEVSELAMFFKVTGRIHKLEENFQKALHYFEKALKVKLQIYGPTHDKVARCYYKIGILLENLDRNDEALTHYKTALILQTALFPEGHRHMALTLSRIGNQYRRKREFERAKKFCNEALVMQKKLLPLNHIDISFTLTYIGKILFDQGEYHNSLSYLVKALKVQKLFSNNAPNPNQTITLISLGSVLMKLNKAKQALKCLQDALSIHETVIPQQQIQLSEIKRKIEEVKQVMNT